MFDAARRQYSAKAQGLLFTLDGYLYSDESGTIQFLTFTLSDLFPQMKGAFDELPNGLVIAK